MSNSNRIAQLQKFRQTLYGCFEQRKDCLMDLLDALSSNRNALSPAELSLNPLFRRDYSALYKAVQQFFQASNTQFETDGRSKQEQKFVEVIASVVPAPVKHPFWVLGLDVTPVPRPYAKTLADRTFIYQPNPIQGNKPINIGHPYSVLSILPERIAPNDAPWSIPLSGQRVSSIQSNHNVGSNQVKAALNHASFPWYKQLSVLVVDSDYSQKQFLHEQVQHKHLVTVARVRTNRVFYKSPPPPKVIPQRGHPKWYGERFDLKNQTSWHPPNRITRTTLTTHRGRQLTVTVKSWHQMLMRGTKKYPMHLHPFTLLQIQMTNAENKLIHQPMWLIAMGQQREELTPLEIWQAYRQRFDLEHFFRFSKQHLLMRAFQTPDVEHEENWIQLTLLAYVQLWASRELAVHLPHSWERYLHHSHLKKITPTTVQRDFTRIVAQVGTPATASKRRGQSSGRAVGESQTPRPRQLVIKKATKLEQRKSLAA